MCREEVGMVTATPPTTTTVPTTPIGNTQKIVLFFIQGSYKRDEYTVHCLVESWIKHHCVC